MDEQAGADQGQAPDPSSPGNAGELAGMAVAALVLGVVGLATSCVGIGALMGIVALVLGVVAINRIDNPANRQRGRGMALAGAITGGIAIGLGLIAPLMIGILLPALSASRDTAQRMQNNSRLRGIHQSMVIYANDNNTHYPGLDAQGDPADLSVANRFQLLLEGDFFDGEFMMSPLEQEESKTLWSQGEVRPEHYSYAMLQVPEDGGRYEEWRETYNADAAVLSDRNTGTPQQPTSLHDDVEWRGGATFNDGRVDFLRSSVLDRTRYGSGPERRDDPLFESGSNDDTWMIHEGN